MLVWKVITDGDAQGSPREWHVAAKSAEDAMREAIGIHAGVSGAKNVHAIALSRVLYLDVVVKYPEA